MLFFKTHKGQVILNFLFSFFAAVVIFGAMMKILHWQGADIAIMVGLLSETIVFMCDGISCTSSRGTTLAEILP